MKEINKKQLISDLLNMEASINLLARQCTDLRKRLDDSEDVKTNKLSRKKEESDLMLRRVMANRERARIKRFGK